MANRNSNRVQPGRIVQPGEFPTHVEDDETDDVPEEEVKAMAGRFAAPITGTPNGGYEAVFYCVDHENEKIQVPGSHRKIEFSNGTCTVHDPGDAAIVRSANQFGLYYEADLPTEIRCVKCGWSARNARAIERHYAKHME